MSISRANVAWESKDGSWNIGFFAYSLLGGYSDPNFDAEWDVEYNYSRFNWVSTGHKTERDAMNAWKGANPGGTDISRYCRDGSSDNESNEHYDAMAKTLRAIPANQRR